jgi:protein required for attachment to host cells
MSAGIPHDALVVVTDSEKCLFLRNRTDGDDPNLEVVRKDVEPNPSTGDQAANRPGRVGESAQPGGHAYDDTDWHELQKDRFAADLAEKLYSMAHAGKFEQLVIVAPPQVLGVLRDEMHKAVAAKVIAEIDKTLTGHPIHEIESIVNDAVAAARDAA